jgi:hypothetical protein
MNNFELIDDYLTNRLGETERSAFEQQVASDPTLKEELDLQLEIIEGVKKARALELKAMLNKVPVSGATVINFPMMRMAASVVGAGVLVAALGYYFNTHKDMVPNMSTSIEDSIHKIDPKEFEPLEEPTDSNKTVETKEEIVKQPTTKTIPAKKKAVSVQPAQPKIEALDPSQEIIDNQEDGASTTVKSPVKPNTITVSHIAVDIISENKEYTFHYKFIQNKLVLFGSFDKSLYEILEINGDNHSVFMYYKENYYQLDEKQTKITPVVAIQNPVLLAKLKEYRSR